MELFKIACPTCATRLKVGHASAVGQILACPKCGSMIEVSAPEGWIAPEAPAPPPDPNARRTIVKLPGTPELPDTASKPFEDFDDIESLLTGSSPAPKSTNRSPKSATASSRAGGGAAPVIHVQPTSKPSAALTPQGVAVQRKKFALQVAAVVTLVVVSIALIVVLITTLFRTDPSEIASKPKPRVGPDNTGSTPVVPDDNSGTANPADPSPNESPNDSTSANGSSVESTLDARSMIAPALVVPPMSITSSDPVTAPPGFEESGADSNHGQQPSLIDQFGDMNALLDGSEGQLSLQNLEDATSADRGQVGIGTIFVRKPDLQTIDIAQGMSVTLNKLTLPDVPLIDAVRTLTEISRVPICYEIEIIEVEGIDITQKVSADFSQMTVGQALDQILQPLGLKASPLTDGVVISTIDRDEWVSRDYSLEGYGSDDPEITKRFVEFVEASFAVQTWQAKGGQGTIQANANSVSVHQTAPVHALIDLLLRKLAAARELANNPGDEAARELLLSRTRRSHEGRGAVPSLAQAIDRPIEGVFTRIAKETGTHVIVNWQALVAEGWTPLTLIPWEGSQETLDQRLRELTNSMNLGIRAIDQDLLLITSQTDLHTQLELEVYPCADLLEKYSVEQLTRIFDSVLGASVDPGRGMSVTLESNCRCWVAILPQPLQVRFEAGLTQLRKDLANAPQSP